jgi:hypothetical protein
VCLAHQDGRCASEAETIYVQQTATCVATADPTAGSATTPFCGLDKGAVALSPTRRLFVVRGTVQGTAWTLQGTATDPQISLVGQQTAVLAGGASPGLRIVGANLFCRALKITRSVDVGIVVSGAATLRLEDSSVDNNGGGGVLLQQSSFDLRNVTVSDNGPGTLNLATWGGIAIVDPPANGSKRLQRVSIVQNKGPGLSCSTVVDGDGVRADQNSTVDVNPTCGVTSCGAPSATCGAM